MLRNSQYIEKYLDDAHYKKIDRLAQVLKTRKFSHAELDEVRRIIRRLSDVPNIIHHDAAWSSVVPPERPQALFGYYQPHAHYRQFGQVGLAANKSFFCYQENVFPLFVNVSLVSRRRHEYLGVDFEYEQAKKLAILSCVISEALHEEPGLQERLRSPKGLPILLPDKYGLYACTAQAIPEANQNDNINFTRRREGMQHHVHDVVFPVNKVRIFVNTYFPTPTMSNSVERIFEAFQRLLADPETAIVLDALWHERRAAHGLFVARTNSQALVGFRPLDKYNELKKKIVALIEDPMWAKIFGRNPDGLPLLDVSSHTLRRLPAFQAIQDRRGTKVSSIKDLLGEEGMVSEFSSAGAGLSAATKNGLPGLGAPLRLGPTRSAAKPFSFGKA
ncbi:MAG: hypothetical protein WAO98_07255 [Alphaproteobacteria bacterium]